VKVITIACESFNRYDVTGPAPGLFTEIDFNNYPAVNTAMSLCLMQYESPLPEGERTYWSPARQRQWFPDIRQPNAFIFNFAKTRVISGPFWASSFDPRFFDPQKVRYNRNARLPEPIAPHFEELKSFLRHDFYDSSYSHLIYWTNIGHAGLGCRVKGEDQGIPVTISNTFKIWESLLLGEVIPLIDLNNTFLIMINDHGTRRVALSYEQSMYDGFLWAYDPRRRIGKKREEATWADLRSTLCDLLGVEELSARNKEGQSLLCL